jgi:hypothetical protein
MRVFSYVKTGTDDSLMRLHQQEGILPPTPSETLDFLHSIRAIAAVETKEQLYDPNQQQTLSASSKAKLQQHGYKYHQANNTMTTVIRGMETCPSWAPAL